MFLAALDQTIIAAALPLISRDLGDVQNLPWVATAYLLAATTVTPLYGKASDIYGRRVMLLLGIATFVAGSIACALAPTMLVLVLARGLQGLGGGGLISLAQTIIADIVSPKERGRYQVRIASVFLTSGLAGPYLGGFLAQNFHWSAIFWINVPLGLLAFAMTNRLLRKLPRHDRPHRLDILGASSMALATTLLMLALNGEGAAIGKGSFWFAALICASIVMWALFALRIRLAAEPLVPLRVLANPVVRTAAIASSLGVGTNVAMTIYVPIYLQAEMNLTASQSGIALIPLDGRRRDRGHDLGPNHGSRAPLQAPPALRPHAGDARHGGGRGPRNAADAHPLSWRSSASPRSRSAPCSRYRRSPSRTPSRIRISASRPRA